MKMKYLDIVVFGKTKSDMADALQHAAEQLLAGTVSETVTFEDGAHVTFDIYPLRDVPELIEKYENYSGVKAK